VAVQPTEPLPAQVSPPGEESPGRSASSEPSSDKGARAQETPRSAGRPPVWVWAIVGVVLVALVAVGVWALLREPTASPGPTAEPTASEEPTAAVEQTPQAPSAGETGQSPYEGMPISTPARGSADRTGLMDAARELTGSRRQFIVWQLYVQGDSAIGDIQEHMGEGVTPGRRWLVTWERVNGDWQGRHFWPYLDASAAEVRSADRFLTSALIERIVYVFPVDAPPRAREAAGVAAASSQPFEIWAPTRLPAGYRVAEETVEPGMYMVRWRNGSREIGMVIGWGDGELGGAEDLVESPANWGPLSGSYASSEELDYDEVSGATTATSELWGDVPEFLLRAVAMSMTRVEP
jgi:hypothetical protein